MNSTGEGTGPARSGDMASGRPLDVEGTLVCLERLARGIQECGSRGEALVEELQAATVRWDQQEGRAERERREKLAAATGALDADLAERRKAVAARHQARRVRIVEARRAVQERRLKAIDGGEARQVFEVQRDMLQANRERESARQQADVVLAAFRNDWAVEHGELAGVEAGVANAFRGHGVFGRLLAEPAAPGEDAAGTAREVFERSQALRARAAEQLARFRRRPLPLLFSALPVWVWAALVGVAHGGFFFVAPRLGWGVPGLPQVGGSFAICLAALAGLHWLGGRLAGGAARELAGILGQARWALDRSEQLAISENQRDKAAAEATGESRAQALQDRWNRVTEEAERQRRELEERLAAQEARAQGRNDRLQQRVLEQLAHERAEAIGRMEEQSAAEWQTFRDRVQAQRAELATRQQGEWDRLTEGWRRLTEECYGTLDAGRERALTAFPDWGDARWDDWSLPTEFLAAAPFARLEVDVAALAGGLPTDPRLALGRPSRLQLPLVLVCPDEGAILLETEQAGREEALAALNNLVLRFLVGAPPGRVVFTILDPVGLGQSFAGLMHLSDHEDRLINRRIWTQPEQIEQRLADLNDHIEKVTQLYLRNEHRTIAEYNEKAGRIAEPYHFLVIADFPGSFSDVALSRLLRIVTNGPRCGVFPLIHWDRRRPLAADFPAEELRRGCRRLTAKPGGFELADARARGCGLVLDPPPSPRRVTAVLRQVGQVSVDANRVEMPFARIAPGPGAIWSLDTAQEVRVPIGLSGATKLQQMALGRGTRQHVLIAGKTGSGKSTLFHVIITNLALWCGPDQVEFYLVDFKKGVEFRCYAAHQLPHARVIAIESDREFALSVLQRVDEELHRRGDLFRRAGAQDLAGYRRSPGVEPLPRTLLLVDEFQEFFTDDDRVAHNAALLLDRLVRQGRAFGIHVLLGSQTLGGAYTLARTTLGQMAVRVALQCNQADALLIMDDDNSAPRLLSRPGEAIYNDAAGATDGNSPFQVVWLSEEEREEWLEKIRRRAVDAGLPRPLQVVFEGNAPADVRENEALTRVLGGRPSTAPAAGRIWLGAPNAIKGPTEVVFQRQGGHHLLCISQAEESALSMLGLAFAALAAQYPRGTVRLALLDASPEGSPHRRFLERLAAAVPNELRLVGPAELAGFMAGLGADLAARSDPAHAAAAPTWFVGIHHIERFKALRFEDDFRLGLDDSAAPQDPGQVLNRVLCEGASLGMHVLCVCDTYSNATRQLSRKALGEFELRVLSQMSANDSASLIDNPKASTLGLHRAILFKGQEGSIEVFRPYALPTEAWLEELRQGRVG